MNDTHHFKKLLLAEKESLEKELETIAQPMAGDPGQWEAVQKDVQTEPDLHDQADQLDQYQENRAIVDVLNPRYQQVCKALSRIEEGTFGICEVGGEEIEQDRLEADPSATTCKAHL
jgi:RNA polymerase-binding transcription factor DksA